MGHELASSESTVLLCAGLSHGKNTLSLKEKMVANLQIQINPYGILDGP